MQTGTPEELISFAKECKFLDEKMVMVPPSHKMLKKYGVSEVGVLYARLDHYGDKRYLEGAKLQGNDRSIALAMKISSESVALCEWIGKVGAEGQQFEKAYSGEEERLCPSESYPPSTTLGVLRATASIVSALNSHP